MFFEEQKELNILPIRLKFVHYALTVFYKIVNKLVDVSMPEYIRQVHPQALRFTRSNVNTIHCRDTSYSCAIVGIVAILVQFCLMVMHLGIALAIL